ncbi:aldehyde dehydrogenase, partial [Streptomyces sp. NPDC005568]
MSEGQRLFVGGAWVPPDDGFYEVTDPATEGVVGLAPVPPLQQVLRRLAMALLVL